MAHVMVIGESGALKEVSLFLARHDNMVSVVGLNQDSLTALKAEAQSFGGKINPISVDYSDVHYFKLELRESIRVHGPVTLAIAHMQASTLPEFANVLVGEVMKHSPVCRYFQLFSLGDLDLIPGHFLRDPFPDIPRLLYRTISIGFDSVGFNRKTVGSGKIASGVIDAIRNDSKYTVVGMDVPEGPAAKSA